MSNTLFLHDIERVTVRHCKPHDDGTENLTITFHAIDGKGSDTGVHVFGSHETRTNPITVEETFDAPTIVENIEPGGLYRIPGFDDNGCWLDDRGVVYVTNIIDDNDLAIVEGIWFDADYGVTNERCGRDGEYRAPALVPYRTATRV